MLTTLVVALLTVTAAPAPAAPTARQPGAACQRCSLLAQADLPPPPLPGEGSPSPRSDQDLRRRVDELNREIRSIDVNWPPGYIVLAYLGYVTAPSGIFGGGLVLLYGFLFSAMGAPANLAAILFTVGAIGLGVGLLGVVSIIWAWTAGNAATDENRRRREELILERQRLEDELRERRRPPPAQHTVQAPVMLTLLRF